MKKHTLQTTSRMSLTNQKQCFKYQSLNVILGVLPACETSDSYLGTNLLTDAFKELIIF